MSSVSKSCSPTATSSGSAVVHTRTRPASTCIVCSWAPKELLGVITGATLKLIPLLPPFRANLAVGFNSMSAAVRALQSIFAAGFLPCAAELADEFTLAAAAKRTKSKRLLGCKAHLIVELDGQEKSVRPEIAAVEKIVRKQKPLFVERGFGTGEQVRGRVANPT